MTENSRLAAAWTEAARQLGLEIVVPYVLTLPSGTQIEATALVKNFGARLGMLVLTDYSKVSGHLAELENVGYGFSVLEEPDPSEAFGIEEYEEILQDWGWTGPHGDAPSWLTPL